MKTRRGCTFLEFGNYTSAVEGTTNHLSAHPTSGAGIEFPAVARGERMARRVSRREFPGALRIGAGVCVFSGAMPFASEPRPFSKSPFRVAFINDEMRRRLRPGSPDIRDSSAPTRVMTWLTLPPTMAEQDDRPDNLALQNR
jgi:hypothetical protein